MNPVSVLGVGLITPWGRDIHVISKTVNHPQPNVQTTRAHDGTGSLLSVPPGVYAAESRLPRLRRSGTLSLLAVAAAADAVAAAGLDEEEAASMTVFFATTDGGVRYTARFFEEVVARGLGAGSPLLFPETVYNAAASHVAARFRCTGEAITLVGDSSAGISALCAAAGAVATGTTDRALVVASNEWDPVSLEAYARWGFVDGPMGNPAAECAAAIVLGHRSEAVELAWCGEGKPFRSRKEAASSLGSLLGRMPQPRPPTVLSRSCQRNPLNEPEELACRLGTQPGRELDVRGALGESFAATTLAQAAVTSHFLQQAPAKSVGIVTVLGLTGGVGALRLTSGVQQE